MASDRESAIQRTQCLAATALSLGLIPILYQFLRYVLHPAPVDAQFIARNFVSEPLLFRPEPLETATYICFLILLVPLLAGLLVGTGRIGLLPDGKLRVAALLAGLFWLAVTLAVLFRCGDFFEPLFNITPHPKVELIGILGAAASAFILSRRNPSAGIRRVAIPALFIACALFFFPLTVADGGYTPADILGAQPFEALFYSVSQVFAGRALLVNLSNLYGLFPHFIEPVLRVTGLTPLSFTMLTWILTCVSYAALLLFLSRTMRSTTVIVLVFASLIYVALSGAPFGVLVPYFQYGPFRTVFPCCALLLFVCYIKRPSRGLLAGSLLLSLAGILWNPETGVVTLGTWLALLFYREFALHRAGAALRRAALHVIAVTIAGCAVAGAYSAYIFLRYHGWPDLRLLFADHILYTRYGFYSSPLPFDRPWILVAALYVFALAKALRGIRDRQEFQRNQVLVVVAVMGAGLFSYFQAKKHDESFLAVIYPAVLLMGLFADRAVTKGRAMAAAGWFVVLAFSTALLPAFVWLQWPLISGRLHSLTRSRVGWYGRDLEFIGRHSRAQEPLAILSLERAGTLHAGTRSASYFDGPGFLEMFRRSEERSRLRQMEAARDVPLFLDYQTLVREHLPAFPPSFLTELVRGWKAADENVTAGGDLVYFRRRESAVPVTWEMPDDSQTILHVRRSESGLLADGAGKYAGVLTAGSDPLSGTFAIEAVARAGDGLLFSTRSEGRGMALEANHGQAILTVGMQKSAAFALPRGEWVRLAVSAGAGHAEVRVNGAPAADVLFRDGMANSNGPLMVGGWADVIHPEAAMVRELRAVRR